MNWNICDQIITRNKKGKHCECVHGRCNNVRRKTKGTRIHNIFCEPGGRSQLDFSLANVVCAHGNWTKWYIFHKDFLCESLSVVDGDEAGIKEV